MTRRTQSRGLKYTTRCKLFAFLCVLPWLIGFLVFTLRPLIDTVMYSFSVTSFHASGAIELQPNGWANYNQAFNVDNDFRLAMYDYLEQIAFIGTGVVVYALLIAMLLNHSFKGRGFFRMMFFLPVVLMQGPLMSMMTTSGSMSVAGVDEIFVFHFIQEYLPEWVSYPILTMIGHFTQSIWHCGVQIMVCLVGLQRMDRNTYEAASIDGASSWQIFWKITLPLSRPFLLLSALYTVIDLSTLGSNAFMRIIVDNMFYKGSGMGYSAAVTCMYFLLILVMIGVVMLLFGSYGKRRRA